METPEEKLVVRLLLFCQKHGLIGAYRVNQETVHIFRAAENHTLTPLAAVKYLIRLLDEADLEYAFREEMRASTSGRGPERHR